MSRREEIYTIVLIAELLIISLVTYLRATVILPEPEKAAQGIHPPVVESVAPVGASYFLPASARSNQEAPLKEDTFDCVPLENLPATTKGACAPPLDSPGESGAAARILDVAITDSGAGLTELVIEDTGADLKDPAGITYEDETRELLRYIGRYWVTGYDVCVECCGKTDGITASGTVATVGRTVAAPADMPFGTVLWIDGIGERVVEDRGGIADNTLDVLCVDHPACYAITGWYDVYEAVFPAIGGESAENAGEDIV